MLFVNPCIRVVIAHAFFKMQPSGSVLQVLDPIPGPLIAMTAAAIECALLTWKTGEFVKTKFSQHVCRNPYVYYRAVWTKFTTKYPGRAALIAKDITDYCITTAGISRKADGGIEKDTQDQLESFDAFGLPKGLESGTDDELPAGWRG